MRQIYEIFSNMIPQTPSQSNRVKFIRWSMFVIFSLCDTHKYLSLVRVDISQIYGMINIGNRLVRT